MRIEDKFLKFLELIWLLDFGSKPKKKHQRISTFHIFLTTGIGKDIADEMLSTIHLTDWIHRYIIPLCARVYVYV